MTPAANPFCFVAASYLIQILPERAGTLNELEQHLRTVSDQSIFYHTFQSLESHHYTVYSNDFAQWCMAACNEPMLAESLEAVDMRDFSAIEELRTALVNTVANHLRLNPQSGDRPAFEAFHFSQAVEFALPLDTCANNLAELVEGIRKMSLQTLHHHFINARLRPTHGTNDFSHWIEHSLNLPQVAEKLHRIDFYTNTLEQLRQEILHTREPWIQA